MELYHLNTSETAIMIGMDESELSEILEKDLGIRVDDFNSFCDKFKISPDWLEYGIGDMRTGIRIKPNCGGEEDFAKLMQITYENNQMLKEILAYIHKVDNDEYVTKKQLHDFINNVVADLYADMLLQPKGRGHVDKEFINDVINKIK